MCRLQRLPLRRALRICLATGWRSSCCLSVCILVLKDCEGAQPCTRRVLVFLSVSSDFFGRSFALRRKWACTGSIDLGMQLYPLASKAPSLRLAASAQPWQALHVSLHCAENPHGYNGEPQSRFRPYERLWPWAQHPARQWNHARPPWQPQSPPAVPR